MIVKGRSGSAEPRRIRLARAPQVASRWPSRSWRRPTCAGLPGAGNGKHHARVVAFSVAIIALVLDHSELFSPGGRLPPG